MVKPNGTWPSNMLYIISLMIFAYIGWKYYHGIFLQIDGRAVYILNLIPGPDW